MIRSRQRPRVGGGSGLGIAPSLLLDFLPSGSLDNRVTFSRSTNATLINSTGQLTYAPSNQIPNSESFTAATWAPTGLATTPVVSNATVAPNGTTTADSIVEVTGGAASDHRIDYSGLAGNAGKYAASVYLKAGTRTFARLQFDATLNAVSSSAGVQINLSDGTLSSTTVVGNITAATATSESVDNGWYRVGLIFTISPVYVLSGGSVRIFLMESLAATPSYIGNGSNIFVWGAQFGAMTYETAPRTYNSTTPKNLLGYTEEFNNAAWVKSQAYIQTNLIFPSDGTTWSATGATVTATANAATSPDGTNNATKIITNDTANGAHNWFKTFAGAVSTAYCGSVYLKAGEYTRAQVNFGNAGFASTTYGALFDLSAGEFVVTTAGSTATITAVGDDWYRCTVTGTSDADGGSYVFSVSPKPASVTTIDAAYTPAATGLGIYIYGAQVVQGATAGNYQQTIAAAAAVQYADPNGYLNADKLVENTATNTHQITQTTAFVSETVYTWSFFVKAAERSVVRVLFPSAAFGSNLTANFDIAVGQWRTGSPTPSAALTLFSQDVGDGWYRISATAKATASVSSTILLMLVDSPSNTGSYAGDGTSGVYIWGAQLSDSASLNPYVYNPAAALTSTAYYGPRFEYDPVTLAPLGLLIEEARTNLLLYSDQLDVATTWPSANIDVTANAIVSPDGTTNADAIIEKTTPTVFHYINQSVTKAASAIQYVASFYVKNKGRDIIINIQSSAVNGVVARINPETGYPASGIAAFGTGWTAGSLTTTSVGDGWYKVVMVATSDTAITAQFQCSLYNVALATNIYTGDGVSGVYIWGAQLEAGSFATSYIPTAGASVTRSADVATMVGNNFSNWYNQTTGTFAASFDASANTNATYMSASNGSIVQNSIHIDNDSGNMRAVYYSGSAEVAALGLGAIGTAGTANKIATAYAVNDFAASRNGGTVATDPDGGAVPVGLTQLNIGVDNRLSAIYYTSNHIKSITYYNSRLANIQLQAITT